MAAVLAAAVSIIFCRTWSFSSGTRQRQWNFSLNTHTHTLQSDTFESHLIIWHLYNLAFSLFLSHLCRESPVFAQGREKNWNERPSSSSAEEAQFVDDTADVCVYLSVFFTRIRVVDFSSSSSWILLQHTCVTFTVAQIKKGHREEEEGFTIIIRVDREVDSWVECSVCLLFIYVCWSFLRRVSQLLLLLSGSQESEWSTFHQSQWTDLSFSFTDSRGNCLEARALRALSRDWHRLKLPGNDSLSVSPS